MAHDVDYNFGDSYNTENTYIDKHWTNGYAASSIDTHVLQGIKCRQEKPTDLRYQTQNTFNVGNIINKCSENKRYKSNNVMKHKKLSSKMKASSFSYRAPKCSMRIAELAIPAKRRCLETWRENYDKLSIFAVERLRKYVMDEYPIVRIPDAIRSFKHASSLKRRVLRFIYINL
ncbi:uncharacterized protein LOC114246328 [Bombyx mandarina]|uniref:Uncharacterized protein LOC114246328 n=1 Tax=Bombyx mandarina TaxID=7092 RepID=A0A6J2JXM0_BOMMA|nr:uncharacterized protein LOC114246328 [Bombyx mandarina]